MVYLKYGIVAAALSLGLLAFVGWILPNEGKIERSIVIDADRETVYEHIINIKTWEEWMHWKEEDPETFFRYPGREIGNRAIMHWKSEDPVVQSGRVRIIEAKRPDSIKANIIYDDNDVADITMKFTLEEDEIYTLLTITHEVKFSGNPLLSYLVLSLENIEGARLDNITNNLKEEAQRVFREERGY